MKKWWAIGAAAALLSLSAVVYAFTGTGSNQSTGWQNLYLMTTRPVLKDGMDAVLHVAASQVGPGTEVIDEVSGPTGFGAHWANYTGDPNWIHAVVHKTSGTYGYQVQVWNNGVETANSPTIYLTWATAANSTSWGFMSSFGGVAAAQFLSAGATASSITVTEDLGMDGSGTACYSALGFYEDVGGGNAVGWFGIENLGTNDTPSYTFSPPADGQPRFFQMTGYAAPTCSDALAKASGPWFVLDSPSNANGVAGLYSLGQMITVSGVTPNAQVWVNMLGASRTRWFTVLSDSSGVAQIPASIVGAYEIQPPGETPFYTDVQY